jgi:hypothetical protein
MTFDAHSPFCPPLEGVNKGVVIIESGWHGHNTTFPFCIPVSVGAKQQ